MATQLHTVNLSLGYQKPLFTDLNLTLPEKRLICLIGRNGAGKSTLLRTLAGMKKPLAGNVFLDGKMMSKMSEKEISKRLSIVLTDPVKVPYMTVNDLVMFGRYPHFGGQVKITPEDNAIVSSAIHSVGIEDLKNRQLTTLSDGERQKAILARSIAQQTDFIILDEPAAFLDFPSKIELMRLLKKLVKEHSKAILLSTHDIEMSIAISDMLWLIDNQRNIITGTPEELIENQIIAETFNIPSSFFFFLIIFNSQFSIFN
jgi:iron complex transport system ATP-binding protein